MLCRSRLGAPRTRFGFGPSVRTRALSALSVAAAAALATSVLLPAAARAGDTWDGGGTDRLFTNPVNWSPDGVPGDSAIPTFVGTSPGIVDLNGSTQPAGSGAVGYSGLSFTGTGGYTLQNGTLLLPTGGVTQNSTGVNTIAAVVSANGSSGGAWNIQAGTLALTNTSTTTPNTFGSSTTFNISTGGTLQISANSSGGSIGAKPVNLNGGTLIVSGTATPVLSGFGTDFTPTANTGQTNGTLTFNSNGNGDRASVTSNVLTITTQMGSEANSAIFNTKVSVGAFTANYRYVDSSVGGADGAVFFLENDSRGTGALGASGGSKGYNNNISPSVGLVFNIYGTSGAGINTNGGNAAPATGSVDVASGHPIDVHLTYDGTNTMSFTLTDATTNAVFNGSTDVGNLQTLLGATQAWAGFSGGTGGVNALQNFSNFQLLAGSTTPSPVGSDVTVTSDSTVTVQTNPATFGALTVSPGKTLTFDGDSAASFTSLAGDGTVTLNVGAPVSIDGAIALTSGGTAFTALNKTGTSVLTLSAASPAFAGTIGVQAGTLAVAADGALGTTAGATTVTSGAQISLRYTGTYATAEPLTLNGTGTASNGALESSGADRSFAGPITLGSNSFLVSSTAGNTLTFTGGVTTAGFEARFGGSGNTLISTSPITGNGSVRKTESGDLTFASGSVNNYTGITNIDAGRLISQNAADLTSTSGVSINNAGSVLEIQAAGSNLAKVTESNGGAILRLSADQGGATPGTIPAAAQTGIVQVNADQGANFTSTGTPAGSGLLLGNGGTLYAFGAGRNYASPLRIQGTVNIGNSGSAGGGDKALTVSSVVSNGTAAGTLAKSGTDTVTLSNTNTYTGATNVNGGTLNFGAVNALPASTTLTVNNAGSIGSLTVNNAAGNATVKATAGGVVQVVAGVTTPGFTSATFSGGGELRYNQGAGVTATSSVAAVSLDGGVVHAQSGIADLSSSDITGTPVVPILSSSFDGRLYEAKSDGSVRNNIQTLLNTAPTNTKAMTASTSPNTINFPSDNSIGTFFGNTNVATNTTGNWSGTFTGTFVARTAGTYTFGVDVQDDNSDIYIDTNNNGTFEQTERILDRGCCNGVGTRTLATVSLAAGTYNFVVANEDTGGGGAMSGVFAEPGGTVQFFSPGATSGGGALQVDAGAELRAKSFAGMSSVTMNGTSASPAVLRLANNVTSTASSAVAFTLAGTNPTGTFDTGGTGNTITVQNVNVATGGTLTVSGAGKVLVNGLPPAGAETGGISVAGTATLGGSGQIAGPVTITSGATLSPGNSPGILSNGNLNLQAGSNMLVELNGITAGSGYDQDAVTGTVTLGGGNLGVSVGYTPSVGDTFVIINNDGVDPVTGTFSTANGGAIVANGFTANGDTFLINYSGATGGADGNDVTLTVTAVPEPAAIGLLALGGVGLLARRRRRSARH